MSRPLNILHLEDNPNDAELVEETLRAAGMECEITRVQDRAGFSTALHEGAWDAILADYSLPAFDGLTALTIAAESGYELPFVFVTGAMGEDMAVETLKHGATDYVLKTRLARLAPAVKRALDEAAERRARRAAEEGLRRASAYNRNLIESSLDPLFTIAPDGKITDVNYAAEKVTGLSREELIGTDFSGYFTNAEKARSAWQHAFRDSAVQDYELDVRHRDGHTTAVLYNASVYRDGTGQPIGVFAAARQIAGRKQAEAMRARLAAIVESSDDAILAKTLDGVIESWNAAAERLYGYPAREAVGLPMSILAPPDLPDEIPGILEKIKRGEPVSHYETRRRRKDGRCVDVAISVSPIRNEQGNIIGASSIARDITERKRMEEAARKSHLLFETLFESLPDAIAATNRDGRLKQVNAAAEKLFGYRRAELLDQPVEMLMPERLRAAHSGYRQHYYSRPVSREMGAGLQLYGRRKDGGEFPVDIQLSTIETGDGLSVLTVIRDITERKRSEAAIRELNASLERRVAARTLELSEANKELEAFSYSVSHDLRAPLRAMDGFCQALMEDHASKLDAEGRHYLDRIRAAAMRMDNLVDGLLGLSRMSRSQMARTEVDLSALAEAIALELRHSDPERRVEFAIAPGLLVNADANLLRIALQNLLGNAWKFTGKHPQARIELGALQHEGETAYFVRDDGAGFDMAYADRLFGAFQRLHTPSEFEGTGIGLATTQRAIHRHGGRVWAEGAVEKGSTVYFTLGRTVEGRKPEG